MANYADLPLKTVADIDDVATTANLPTNVAINTIRYVVDIDTFYVWNGASWTALPSASKSV